MVHLIITSDMIRRAPFAPFEFVTAVYSAVQIRLLVTGPVDRECRIQLNLAKAIIFAVDELLNTRTCDVPSSFH